MTGSSGGIRYRLVDRLRVLRSTGEVWTLTFSPQCAAPGEFFSDSDKDFIITVGAAGLDRIDPGRTYEPNELEELRVPKEKGVWPGWRYEGGRSKRPEPLPGP
jgi:hypothetical protein